MVVARQATTAIASKARIMLRQILGRILSAARWGWLAGAAWRAYSRLVRGIGLAALDASG